MEWFMVLMRREFHRSFKYLMHEMIQVIEIHRLILERR